MENWRGIGWLWFTWGWRVNKVNRVNTVIQVIHISQVSQVMAVIVMGEKELIEKCA